MMIILDYMPLSPLTQSLTTLNRLSNLIYLISLNKCSTPTSSASIVLSTWVNYWIRCLSLLI